MHEACRRAVLVLGRGGRPKGARRSWSQRQRRAHAPTCAALHVRLPMAARSATQQRRPAEEPPLLPSRARPAGVFGDWLNRIGARGWLTAGSCIAAAPLIAVSLLVPDYKQSFAALLVGFALRWVPGRGLVQQLRPGQLAHPGPGWLLHQAGRQGPCCVPWFEPACRPAGLSACLCGIKWSARSLLPRPALSHAASAGGPPPQ